MFASLGYRDFRLIWLGQTSHALALWAQLLALPLLVLEVTGNDAAQLGVVIAVRTAPMLVFGVVAGVVADWFNRRTILLITKWNSLLLGIVIAVLVATGRIELWHIYVWVFIRGSSQAFEQPARYSLVPSLLPDYLLTNAMALLSSTQSIMRIVGAAGAGIVAGFAGLEVTFVMIAVIYSAGVIMTHMVRVPSQDRPAGTGIRSMAAGVAEGARFSIGHPAIRGVLLISLVYYAFGMSYMQVFAPLFAIEVLEIGSSGLGLMLALTGAGALVAALFIASAQPSRLGLILPATAVAIGAVLVAFSAATYLPGSLRIVVPLVLMTVVGAFSTSFMSLSRSLMLQATPPTMRGRVLAFLSLDRAMMAVGGATGGIMAAAYGVQVTQMVFGGLCVAGGIVVLMTSSGLRAYVVGQASPRRARAAPTGGSNSETGH